MDYLGDRRFVVPVRIRTLFFGICIRRKTILMSVNAKHRKDAAFNAVAKVRGEFNEDRQTAEILSPLLDVEFMAIVATAKKGKKRWWRRLFNR